MLEWSVKRKIIYISFAFSFLFIVVFIPYFFISNKESTCFDGVRNQGEEGVDCSGPCKLICSFQIRDPIVLWSRIFEVTPGFYSAVALVENPNINSKTDSITYSFKIRDSSGSLILEKSSETFIPNSRLVAIFEPNIKLDGVPVRADFEFTEKADWYHEQNLKPEILIRKQSLLNTETLPRVDVRIENDSVENIRRLESVAIVFDGSGTAIAASRTFVDNFNRGESVDLVFTWPQAFPVREEVCQIPVDTFLVFDRSGSMIFDNWDFQNPEPLTSSKSAASNFLDAISSSLIRVGLVSFSTEAILENPLTDEHFLVKNSIDQISIKAETIDEIWNQETNIAEGLELAFEELRSEGRQDAEKIIIVFTDGVPTHPKDENNTSDYPISHTKSLAEEIKTSGIDIFSIGLGQEQAGKDFLRSISSSDSNFFLSPQVSGLNEVFGKVAEEICRQGATSVEIITRVLP